MNGPLPTKWFYATVVIGVVILDIVSSVIGASLLGSLLIAVTAGPLIGLVGREMYRRLHDRKS
jgi:hypothetical protein